MHIVHYLRGSEPGIRVSPSLAPKLTACGDLHARGWPLNFYLACRISAPIALQKPLKACNRNKGRRADLDDIDRAFLDQLINLGPPYAGHLDGRRDADTERLDLLFVSTGTATDIDLSRFRWFGHPVSR